MKALLQLPRTLYNVLLLRGRRRVTRLFLLLVLSVLVMVVLKQVLCVLNPGLCQNGDDDYSYRKPLNDFEVEKREHIDQQFGPHRSIMEGNGAKSHPEERQKTGEQDGGELIVNHQDSRQERTGESNDGHERNVEGGGRVQDGGEENQNYGDKDEAVQDKLGQDSNLQDGRTDLAGANAPIGQSQVGIPQQNTLGQVPPPGPGPAQQVGVVTMDKGMTLLQNQNQAVQQLVKNAAPPPVVQPVPGVLQPSNPPPVRKTTVATTEETDPPTLPLPGVRMSAEEVAKAIRSGQMCRTVCPPFVWSEWSPCSKACGQGRRYRKAIYDFVCQASEKCPLNRIEESICDVPCKFDPEKYGGPGGLDMYPINPLNPPMYPEDSKYRCGHWLVEYERLHNEIVTGKRPPAYLLYTSGRGDYPTAGGIAGRMRGISTVFFMAVLLERAFLIEWVDPPGLDEYLEPKSFNWADLTPIRRLRRGPMRDIGSWRSAKDSGRSSQWYMNTNFSTFFTSPLEVVQGHRYDFTYAVLRNPGLMPKAYELGVDRIKCRICCAWDMLFKMTSKFEKEMDGLIKSLGVPRKSLMTIQARTRSDDIQAAVAISEQFVSCAMKAGRELKILHKMVWVPVFNNRLVVHIVAKKYAERMKTPIRIDSATRTVHTHLGNLPPDTEVGVVKGVQDRSFKEFFLMMNSSVIIRTKGYVGSFGNVADAIRRFYAAPGSIYTYTAGGGCSRFPDNYKIE